MRAMILAAGLGNRMQPLSGLRAKPALPVLGLPVIVTLLELLKHHGFREVVVNVHAHGQSVRDAVEEYGPRDVQVRWSEEETLLGTGGGIRRAVDFLRESETSVVLAGDMLLDLDLGAAIERHRARDSRTTLLLRRDPRIARFGSIGIDREGHVRRVGRHSLREGETAEGLFLSVRLFSARAFDDLPDRATFEDLADWIIPGLERGARDIHADLLDPGTSLWEPVGTPREYLAVNLEPPALSYLPPDAILSRSGARVEGSRIIGRGAQLGTGCRLERCVIWDRERVPANQTGTGGVFACGNFHACLDTAESEPGGARP